MLTPQNFILPFAIATVVGFGIVAVAHYYHSVRKGLIRFTTDFFLTAQGTQPWYRIAWGFYSLSVGSAVIFAIPSFVVDPVFGGGWVGLITYSVFSGLPLIIVSLFGILIKSRYPSPLSIGSVAKWRFGNLFQFWVTLNVLFNLGVALTVEFTAVGGIFSQFLDVPAYVPIIVVSVVTMTYSSIGGLYVSLFTDVIQSFFIIALLIVMSIFVAVSFRVPELGPLPPYLGVNDIGLASIATLGISLITSTFFSDSVWQRVWAAKDNSALITGSIVGASMTTFVSFLFGLGGFVAAWANLVDVPNNAFLELLKVNGDIPLGMLLVVILLSSVMNESAVDSFQIGMGDTLISLFESFKIHMPLWAIRVILALLNVPFAIVGCYGLPVVSLYLVTNTLTTCLFVPFVLGLIPQLDYIVNGSNALFGSMFGLLAVCFYAVWNQVANLNGVGTFQGWSDVVQGLTYTFYTVYSWQPFLIGLGFSFIGVFLYAGVEFALLGFDKSKYPIPAHLVKSPYEEGEDGKVPAVVEIDDQSTRTE